MIKNNMPQNNTSCGLTLQGIVAMNPDGIIGRNGRLPWRIPEDLEFFKETTHNTIVVMGRKTFESLKKPLTHRIHLVISRTYEEHKEMEKHPRVHWCNMENVFDVLKGLYRFYSIPIFIIGGADIFHIFENLITTFYVTIVYKSFTPDRQIECTFLNNDFLRGFTLMKNWGKATSITGYEYEITKMQTSLNIK